MAIKVAGLDYATIRKHRSWTKAAVISAIRRAKRLGDSLSHSSIRDGNSALRHAAIGHFGSWDGALKGACIEPDSVRGLRKWDKPSILAEIRKLALKMPLKRIGGHDKSLRSVAQNRFGGWPKAIRATGFRYS